MLPQDGGRFVTNLVMMGMGEPLYNFDAVRDALLVAADNEGILAACRAYPGLSNARRITFEYVMLKGVNDSTADTKALVKLLRGIQRRQPLSTALAISFRCQAHAT
jgi:adenine C2-methylase RlmN of 23S rRNA A2503 and tRNA A37